ncbi:MAG: redoxin family protein [Gemmatimonadaceae bacterium]|nr:redoxin family protein [Gemmatimonadaceae bacterium]
MKISLIVGCLFLALVTVVIEGFTIRRLRTENQYRRALALSMAPGATIASAHLPLLHGDSVDISSGPKDSLRLVFVLTTTCPKCAALLPDWKSLADSLEGRSIFKPIAVAASPHTDVEEWALKNRVKMPIAVIDSGRLASQLRAALVPQVAILNPRGVVVYSALGVTPRDSIVRVLNRFNKGFISRSNREPTASAQ